MTTAELAKAVGEKPEVVVRMIAAGKLQANKIPDDGPVGYHYEVTTSVEDAKTIMATRVRHKSPERRAKTAPAPVALPTKRDLFKPKEAAKMAGINESTMYKWMKENKIETLRNGRSAYISRTVVERMRDTFMPKTPAVVAPQVLTAKVDPAVGRIEKKLDDLIEFVRGFAKSCGYEG